MATKFKNAGACLIIIAGQRVPPGEHCTIQDGDLEAVEKTGLVKARILVKGDPVMPSPVVIPPKDSLPEDMVIALAAVKLQSDMGTLGRWLGQERSGSGRSEVLEALNDRMGKLSPPPPPASAVQYSPDGKHFLDTASNTWKPVVQ